MNVIITIFNLFVLVFIGALYYIMPSLINKYLLFGVTINDEIVNDIEIIAVKREYRQKILLVSIISILLYIVFSLMLTIDQILPLFFVFLLVMLIFTYIIYFNAHKKIKKIKSNYNLEEITLKTVDTKADVVFKVLSPVWYILYLAVIMMLVFITINQYPKLPETLATHFDLNGISNGFIQKSYGVIILQPIIMLIISILFIFMNYTFRISKKVSGVSSEKLSLEQENKFRYLWSIALYIIGLGVLIFFALIQLNFIRILDGTNYLVTLNFILEGTIIVIVFGLAIYTGQSGSRIKIDKKIRDMVDKDDDSNWKGGIIYFNPKDPSIFVNKRFGIGITLNFGCPISWVFIVVIIGVIIFSIIKGQ